MNKLGVLWKSRKAEGEGGLDPGFGRGERGDGNVDEEEDEVEMCAGLGSLSVVDPFAFDE